MSEPTDSSSIRDRQEQTARDIAAAFPAGDPVETLATAIDSEIRGAHGMAEGFRATGEKLKGVEW